MCRYAGHTVRRLWGTVVQFVRLISVSKGVKRLEKGLKPYFFEFLVCVKDIFTITIREKDSIVEEKCYNLPYYTKFVGSISSKTNRAHTQKKTSTKENHVTSPQMGSTSRL